MFTGPAVPWMTTRMIFKCCSLVVVAGINGDSAYTQHTTSRLVLFFFLCLIFFFFLPNFTSLSLVGEILVAASLVRIENKQTTLK